MNYLFTTLSCPNCPRAKRLLEEKHVDCTMVNASDPKGFSVAKHYGISSVPSFLVTAENGEQRLCVSGLEDISAYLKNLCSSPDFKN